MNEPVRLSMSGSPRTRKMLLAGRAERPRDRAKVEAAAAALLITSGHMELASRLNKSWLARLIVGIGVGVAFSGAIVAMTSSRAPVLSVDEVLVDRPSPTVRARTPEGFTLRDDAARVRSPYSPYAPLSPPPRTPSASEEAPTTPTELELLRHARRDLTQRKPAAALTVLDRHASLYPEGKLREEAAALRVEALARSGDTSGARALAARFVRAHPNSPYAERVQSIATSWQR